MSRLTDKFRARRNSARRERAIASALSRTSSPAMRDEILTIANRDY